jgi:hypothetical protein
MLSEDNRSNLLLLEVKLSLHPFHIILDWLRVFVWYKFILGFELFAEGSRGL